MLRNLISRGIRVGVNLWCSGAAAVVYDAFGLGYAELRKALRSAHRKWRVWRRTKEIHKGLLGACVRFTKKGARIVDAKVIRRLRVAFRELGITNRRTRILMDGEIKASEMLIRCKESGVFRWAPQLKAWLRDQAYKFWLGTIQTTLEDKPFSIVRVDAG